MALYEILGQMDGKDRRSIRNILQEEYSDVDLQFMTEEEYDRAIIGVSTMSFGTENYFRVVYDWDLVIEINMKMGMTEGEALEYFDYNQGGAYIGEHTPVYMRLTKNIIGE